MNNKKDKMKKIIANIIQAMIKVLFCTAVVLLYSKLFGNENALVGVVAVIFFMAFRTTNMGLNMRGSLFAIVCMYLIFMIFPHMSTLVNPWIGFLINFIGILSVLILGCHNLIMYNHIIVVICYFLLQSTPVTGKALILRYIGLIISAGFTCLIYYHNHKKEAYKRSFLALIKEFTVSSSRGQFYLMISFTTCIGVCLGTILQLPCPRWIAFAAASVLPPFAADAKQNLIHRVPGNMVGCLIFALFISFAPATLFPYIGLMAGFAGNLVTKYIYKTAVNTIAAVSTVYVLMGMSTTLLARISLNIIGVVLAIIIRATWDLVHRLRSRRTITITADAV